MKSVTVAGSWERTNCISTSRFCDGMTHQWKSRDLLQEFLLLFSCFDFCCLLEEECGNLQFGNGIPKRI